LISTTVRALERELAGHEVKIEIPEKLPLARLDFTLMQQALANLLLNAAVHAGAGTGILVQARHETGELILTVADHGPGLPPEFMTRIFDKFFRAPDAPAGGSGLGLAIVKGFVEAHGGRISAANRPGGGAVFAINIPQKEKPPSGEIA
jgi:two-component system sensor histidine kinase KdpD